MHSLPHERIIIRTVNLDHYCRLICWHQACSCVFIQHDSLWRSIFLMIIWVTASLEMSICPILILFVLFTHRSEMRKIHDLLIWRIHRCMVPVVCSRKSRTHLTADVFHAWRPHRSAWYRVMTIIMLVLILHVVLMNLSYEVIDVNLFWPSNLSQPLVFLPKVDSIKLSHFIDIALHQFFSFLSINSFNLFLQMRALKKEVKVRNICGVNQFLMIEVFDDLLIKLPSHVFSLLLHRTVPVILDAIICSSFQHLRYLSPLVAKLFVLQIQDPLFLATPVVLLDLWIQMVVPSLSALFPDSAG